MRMWLKYAGWGAVMCLFFGVASSQFALAGGGVAAGDWPMWGGSMDRNMVAEASGLPAEWDDRSGENVKWVADLGSNSYGNPVISGGKVFLGTNNDLFRDPEVIGDKGIVMALREADGSFLWQMVHDKLDERTRSTTGPFRGCAPRRWSMAIGSTTSAAAAKSWRSIRRVFAMVRTTGR